MAPPTFSKFGCLPPEVRNQIWDKAAEAGHDHELHFTIRDRIYLTSVYKSRLVPEDEGLYCQLVTVYTPTSSGRGPIWNTYAESRAAVRRMATRVDNHYTAFRQAMETSTPGVKRLLHTMDYIWVPDSHVAECSKTSDVWMPEPAVGYSPWDPVADNVRLFHRLLQLILLRACQQLWRFESTPVFFRREVGRSGCYGLSTPVALGPFDRVFWLKVPTHPAGSVVSVGPMERILSTVMRAKAASQSATQ